MRKYRLVAKTGEGTFSEVLKAQNVKDGKYHAIKCMKNRFESIDQVNNLREIQALRRLSPHDHVVMLEEVLYDQPTGRLALVFELMDANLYEIIKGKKQYLNATVLKSYMWQLMKSLEHMHKKGIFHRDIKPENILVRKLADGGEILKLADFGSCRGIYSKQPYTEYISTRWYRAPECLLTDGYYGPEMDLWGAGCVMFEINSLYPLFPGSNEVDQINRIHKILGTPPTDVLQKLKSKGASHISFDFPEQRGVGIASLLTHAGADSVDLIVKMLRYDAGDRISAREVMRHPYFKEMKELEARRAANDQMSMGSSSVVLGSSTTGVVTGPSTNVAGNASNAANGNSNNSSQKFKSGQPAYGVATNGSKVIGSGSVTEESSVHSSYQYADPKKAAPKNSNNSSGAYSQGNYEASGKSSLPPILGHNSYVSNTAQGGGGTSSVASIHSSTNPGGVNKVKKKKYNTHRINYGQRTGQNTEQVMKAYGISSGNQNNGSFKLQSLNI